MIDRAFTETDINEVGFSERRRIFPLESEEITETHSRRGKKSFSILHAIGRALFDQYADDERVF